MGASNIHYLPVELCSNGAAIYCVPNSVRYESADAKMLVSI